MYDALFMYVQYTYTCYVGALLAHVQRKTTENTHACLKRIKRLWGTFITIIALYTRSCSPPKRVLMPFDVLTSPFKIQIYKYIRGENKALVLKNKSVGKVLLMVVFTRETVYEIIFWQRKSTKQIFINHPCTAQCHVRNQSFKRHNCRKWKCVLHVLYTFSKGYTKIMIPSVRVISSSTHF